MRFDFSKLKKVPFLNALMFSNTNNKRGFCLIKRSNRILPAAIVESLVKREDLPRWETNIAGFKMNGNEALLSCSFGVEL